MGDYEGAIKDCDDAVARGRELRADYTLVGRALARKGNALVKLGRLQEVGGCQADGLACSTAGLLSSAAQRRCACLVCHSTQLPLSALPRTAADARR